MKVFGENLIDEKTKCQMLNAMNEDWVKAGALMPDAHYGYSLPIGGVVLTEDVVVPAWVGYDIGCGVCAIRTNRTYDWIKAHQDWIFREIYQAIPTGFQHNTYATTWRAYANIPSTEWLGEMFHTKGGFKQLGTLGSGNHFIEIGHDNKYDIWIVIHSGSRNVGHSVATRYMKIASKMHTGIDKAKEGNFGFVTGTPEAGDYLMDMNFCLEFALQNRIKMLSRLNYVFKALDMDSELDWNSLINKTHNHVEYEPTLDGYLHRKGATKARDGEMGVIPGNMKSGSFIVRGKGNPESLFSSSHGAGRTMSRKKAKEELKLDDFRGMMEGIRARVSQGTLDESPPAYKPIMNVMLAQSDNVDVVSHIKPIINIKA